MAGRLGRRIPFYGWRYEDSTNITDKPVIIEDAATNYLQLPSLTTAERDALTAVNGMMIYNETTNAINGYENGSWVDL